MTRYRTLDHPVIAMIRWDPEQPAEWVNDHIAMVHATSNSYLIPGEHGDDDLVINTGTALQGASIRAKYEDLLGRPLKVSRVISTQNHADHIGGWKAFADPQTEFIAQRMASQLLVERDRLSNFFGRRYANVISAMMTGSVRQEGVRETWPDKFTTYDHEMAFTQSGRRLVLKSLWSGETLDSTAVWLPDERTVFTGNWAGAIHGALPNFYTARGDRQRSVPGWLGQCRDLLAEEPELLITGHEQPIRGKDRIRADLTKVHDAVRFIHDETVARMDAGTNLPAIMAAITLPEHLKPRDGRCPPSWIVRAVYEEYAGWFHQEHTSELYPTPQSVIWAELVERAGGAEEVAGKAKRELDAGNPDKALHFIEMAVFVEPLNPAVRQTELAVLDKLADATEGRIFDLLGWLEGRITAARAAIEQARNA